LAPSTAQASERRTGPLRVLVIDDEPDTVITLLELVRDEGYEAKGFANPMQAMRELREFDPDIVISDLAMPMMTGWDLARKVRQKMGETRPILIAVSGVYQKSTDKELSTIVGYDSILSKPCDPQYVLAVLGKAKERLAL
jgi:CheY-like chemotaxis protein